MIKIKFLTLKKQILESSIVKGSLIIVFGILLCKIIGIVYRIPLTQILGVEGVGIYQLIFPIYSFLLILSSNAIPVGFSRLIAIKLKDHNFRSIACIKKIGLNYFCKNSLIFSLLLIIFAYPISLLQGNENTVLGYIAIAPSIFFVCLISVYRGIFQGCNSMKQTAISQIIEQVVKLILGIILPIAFASYGLNVQVCTSLVGITLSEIVAFLYIYVEYKKSYVQKNISNYLQFGKEEEKNILSEVKKNVLPILITNLVVPLCVMLESFMIINILTLTTDVQISTAMYGVYSGIVCVLINAPISLISSLGIVLIPNVAKDKKLFKVKDKIYFSKRIIINNVKYIKSNRLYQDNLKIKKVLKYSSLVSILCIMLFILFPKLILEIIYPSLNEYFLELSYILLMICSSNILTQSIANIRVNCMQARGYFYEPIKVLCIMNILRLFIGCLTLYQFGIIGFAVSNSIIFLFQLLQIIKVFKL